jgi:hypothetical protein
MSGILLVHYHGAATRVDPAATAFAHRHPGYSLVVAAQWLNPADTDLNIGWARDDGSTGASVNGRHRVDGVLGAEYGSHEVDLDEAGQLVGV